MEDSLVRAFGGLSLQQPRRARGRPPARRFSKSLYLLRGLPGSGKSTLARLVKYGGLRDSSWLQVNQEAVADEVKASTVQIYVLQDGSIC